MSQPQKDTQATTILAIRELLDTLLSFNTVSRLPNRELMEFIKTWLSDHGISAELVTNKDGSKANLYASVGPTDLDSQPIGGVMLSGHTDVVPVEGQHWTVDPFALTEKQQRYYGRGSTDMKGFVACALLAMKAASNLPLATPLHLALSYDEEIGCLGVRSLIDHLKHQSIQPQLCIVGEPTEMQVATRHKGKLAARASFTGVEAHSALAPNALNAIHLACDFVQLLREEQASLANAHEGLDRSCIPYTTLHAGIIAGGTALNIVPNQCSVDFEIRNAPGDDTQAIFAALIEKTEQHMVRYQTQENTASVKFEVINEYPALDTPADDWAVHFVKSLLGANATTEVAFGTEAGLFSRDLKVSSIVCGPGSMDQGHKPDEYITIDQLNRCHAMLHNLVNHLSQSSPGTPYFGA